jgi:hypothetical protein
MDENVRQVLIGAISIVGALAGALGGAWLGWFLEGKRRHDENRLKAYGELYSAFRLAMRRQNGGHYDHWDDTNFEKVNDAVTVTALVASPEVVRAAERARESLNAWTILGSYKDAGDSDGWLAARDTFEKSERDFLAAARRELGVGIVIGDHRMPERPS